MDNTVVHDLSLQLNNGTAYKCPIQKYCVVSLLAWVGTSRGYQNC